MLHGVCIYTILYGIWYGWYPIIFFNGDWYNSATTQQGPTEISVITTSTIALIKVCCCVGERSSLPYHKDQAKLLMCWWVGKILQATYQLTALLHNTYDRNLTGIYCSNNYNIQKTNKFTTVSHHRYACISLYGDTEKL